MLKKLHLEYFQGHEDTTVEFTTGINAIIGASQAGKSALANRALRMLMSNKPLGPKYLNRKIKSGAFVVTGEFDDHVVSLRREIKTTNSVRKVVKSEYNIIGDAGYSYSGMGQEIPEEITKCINMSALNVQDQQDPHFLITGTAGEMTLAINEILKTDQYDDWIRVASTLIKDQGQELQETNKQIITVEQELERLKPVDKLVELWKEIADIGIEIENAEQKLTSISCILDAYEEAEKFVLRLKPNIQALDVLMTELNKNIEQTNTMNLTLAVYEKYTTDLSLENLFSRGVSELDELMLELETIDKNIIDNTYKIEILNEFIKLQQMLKSTNGVYGQRVSAYVEAIGHTDRCPTCFSSITPARINRIKKNLTSILHGLTPYVPVKNRKNWREK